MNTVIKQTEGEEDLEAEENNPDDCSHLDRIMLQISHDLEKKNLRIAYKPHKYHETGG